MKKILYTVLYNVFLANFTLAGAEEEECLSNRVSIRYLGAKHKSEFKKLPLEMIYKICFELEPKSIVILSTLTHSLRTTLTSEDFWECYLRVRHQEKWNSSIPAIKVAFSYSLFDMGKFLQAAHLGLPKAKDRLEYDQTIKKKATEGSNKTRLISSKKPKDSMSIISFPFLFFPSFSQLY